MRPAAKYAITFVIVACVAFFFYRAFHENWAELRASSFEADYPFLGAACLFTLGAMLLLTASWQISINATAEGTGLTFAQSVAAVNTSSLTKYVPGKLWSYALQMRWLSGAGVGKLVVVYANFLNLGIALVVSTLTGLFCLGLAAVGTERALVLGVSCVLGAAYAAGWLFHSHLLGWLAELAERILKRRIQFFSISPRALLQMHLAHFLAAVFSGFANYLICLGVGHGARLPSAMLIISSSLLGDVVGFLALVVPGGIGVREGVMLWMLGGTNSGPIALLLPLVSRVLNMSMELVLGAIALLLLRKLSWPVTDAHSEVP